MLAGGGIEEGGIMVSADSGMVATIVCKRVKRIVVML